MCAPPGPEPDLVRQNSGRDRCPSTAGVWPTCLQNAQVRHEDRLLTRDPLALISESRETSSVSLCRSRRSMLPQVRPHEGADGDDAQPCGTRGLECRLNQCLTDVTAAQSRGHLRVDQRQRVVAPLVQKKRRVAVHGELKAICRPVLDDRSAVGRQSAHPTPPARAASRPRARQRTRPAARCGGSRH